MAESDWGRAMRLVDEASVAIENEDAEAAAQACRSAAIYLDAAARADKETEQ